MFTENDVNSEIYSYENTSSIASSDTDVTCQQDECLSFKGQSNGHKWKCSDFSSDESVIDYYIEKRGSDVSTDESVDEYFNCSESEYTNDFDTSAQMCSSISDVDSLTKELIENHNSRTNDDPIFTELYHASFEDCTPVNGEKIRHVFTDWGPFVEELVDVFEDIACLSDEVNPFSNRIDCRTIFEIFV